jgi:hypothetical protein
MLDIKSSRAYEISGLNLKEALEKQKQKIQHDSCFIKLTSSRSLLHGIK